MMNANGEMSDYEKEVMRAAAEITKGVFSNPNIHIFFANDTLFIKTEQDNEGVGRNIAAIYNNAITGVKNRMDR